MHPQSSRYVGMPKAFTLTTVLAGFRLSILFITQLIAVTFLPDTLRNLSTFVVVRPYLLLCRLIAVKHINISQTPLAMQYLHSCADLFCRINETDILRCLVL